MTETQASIAAWADATFGPAKSLASVAARANREMAELVQKAIDGAPDAAIVEEAADVLIVLARYAAVCGQDISKYVAPRLSHSNDRVTLVFAAAGGMQVLMRDSHHSLSTGGRMVRAASVAHELAALIRVCGGDAQQAIDAKMAVNRTRRWALDGNGHGQHMEGAA